MIIIKKLSKIVMALLYDIFFFDGANGSGAFMPIFDFSVN
jgi:hypothetical protein